MVVMSKSSFSESCSFTARKLQVSIMAQSPIQLWLLLLLPFSPSKIQGVERHWTRCKGSGMVTNEHLHGSSIHWILGVQRYGQCLDVHFCIDQYEHFLQEYDAYVEKSNQLEKLIRFRKNMMQMFDEIKFEMHLMHLNIVENYNVL